MDVRTFGFEAPVMSALQHLLDHVHADEAAADKAGGSAATPTRAYVRDARAMAATPADVKELPGVYAFVVDMPGLGSGDVRVQVEDDSVLAISGGERGRPDEEEAAGTRYLRMERRMGKLMRKFVLPGDADVGKVSAVCRDGVLTVTVEKLPPPEPKKPRTIQVSIA